MELREFTSIYEEYRKYVAVVIRCYCNDSNIQEDLFQEVWINIGRSWSRFNHQSKISTWIYSLTKFTVLQYKRGHRYIGREKCLGDAQWCSGVQLGFESGLIDWTVLKEAFLQLEPEGQQMIIMKYALGMSLAEIAGEFDLSESTAKGRLSLAKKKLRGLLMCNQES